MTHNKLFVKFFYSYINKDVTFECRRMQCFSTFFGWRHTYHHYSKPENLRSSLKIAIYIEGNVFFMYLCRYHPTELAAFKRIIHNLCIYTLLKELTHF